MMLMINCLNVKPIVPYTTVPKPALGEEMLVFLAKNKVEKLNKINDIPDGTTVKLRLDIPYTHGICMGSYYS